MSTTEVTLVTGERYDVEGSPEDVSAAILGASRGSIMQLAWLTEATSRESIGVNPRFVVTVRLTAPTSLSF